MKHARHLQAQCSAIPSTSHSPAESAPLEDGRDLLDMICKSYQKPRAPGDTSSEDDYDFSA